MNDEQSGGASGVSAASLMNASLPGSGSALGSDIQGKIGQHLRAMYDDVVRQGVPDRFMDLLAKLDQSTASAARDDAPGERNEGDRR